MIPLRHPVLYALICVAIMAMFIPPTASADPVAYHCSAEIVDETANQVVNQAKLSNVIMYGDLITDGNNMPVYHMVRAFDRMPGGMSTDDYAAGWLDACQVHYMSTSVSRTGYVLIVISTADHQSGIYTNALNDDGLEDLQNIRAGLQTSVLANDYTNGASLAVSQISDISQSYPVKVGQSAGGHHVNWYNPVDENGHSKWWPPFVAVGVMGLLLMAVFTAARRAESRSKQGR